jgi:hypothetical protein
MAPTDGPVVDELKSIIAKLETRVEQLEHKLAGRDAASTSMRMILMGPPGAGMQRSLWLKKAEQATKFAAYRQGNASSENKGQILHMSSRTFRSLS